MNCAVADQEGKIIALSESLRENPQKHLAEISPILIGMTGRDGDRQLWSNRIGSQAS